MRLIKRLFRALRFRQSMTATLSTLEREIVVGDVSERRGDCPRFEHQDTDVWCWAACVRMAITMFSASPDDCQCRIAEKGVNLKTSQDVRCCQSSLPSDCRSNPQPGCFELLDRDHITRLWGLYSGIDVEPIVGSIDADCLKRELNLNHLVEINYSGAVGHVVLVCSWTETPPSVVLLNPESRGETTKPFEALSFMTGFGRWSDTWIIKRGGRVRLVEASKEGPPVVAANEIDSDFQTLGIADQIGKLLPAVYSVPKSERGRVTLRQSLEVWTIDIKDIVDTSENARFPAHLANYRHHQIAIAGRAAAFALSESRSGSEYVTEVTTSPIAERIESAISDITVDITDDNLVRLLVIRSLGVYAFWLVQSDRINVVLVPEHLTKLSNGQELSTGDFMKTLRQDLGKYLSKLVDEEGRPSVPW